MNTTSRSSSRAKRRVVVTGLGAVTALGGTMPETWAGIMAGRSPAARIKRFDPSGFLTQIAYEVASDGTGPAPVVDLQRARSSAAARFGQQAAIEALAQARLPSPSFDRPERTAVCLGVGMSSPDLDWYDDGYIDRRVSAASAAMFHRCAPQALTSMVAKLGQARGGNATIHTACGSSGQALGEAYELVAHDLADLVLTGGADSMINPLFIAGFSLLGALSCRNGEPATASRPFDAGRDGFVMGEGACVLVFEELGHALRRQAPILGEVCGYGVTTSAYRVTDLHPDGRGPREAMLAALLDAGVQERQVGYVNAHGTSTPLNDRIEAKTIRSVFDPATCDVRVSSTKSMTGHMIAAAGAIEFTITVEALRLQTLPPSINVFAADAECPVTLTPQRATLWSFDYALSNSVGFGGCNSALIGKRYRP